MGLLFEVIALAGILAICGMFGYVIRLYHRVHQLTEQKTTEEVKSIRYGTLIQAENLRVLRSQQEFIHLYANVLVSCLDAILDNTQYDDYDEDGGVMDEDPVGLLAEKLMPYRNMLVTLGDNYAEGTEGITLLKNSMYSIKNADSRYPHLLN